MMIGTENSQLTAEKFCVSIHMSIQKLEFAKPRNPNPAALVFLSARCDCRSPRPFRCPAHTPAIPPLKTFSIDQPAAISVFMCFKPAHQNHAMKHVWKNAVGTHRL